MKFDERFESLWLGLLLALAGGSLDCYTYLNRGQVFATAETGNLVLIGVRLAQGQIGLAGRYVLPVLAYAAGVLCAEVLRWAVAGKTKLLDWRQLALLLECTVVAVVFLLPVGEFDPLANVLISFTSAMQVESFRRFAGCPCVTTMCTGNLRSGTEDFFLRFVKKDLSAGKKAFVYYGLILSFVIGAVFCGVLTNCIGEKSILLPGILLVSAFILSHYDLINHASA